MSNANDLIGLTLSTVGRPQDLKGAPVTHSLEIAPEGGRDASVIRVLHDVFYLTILDVLAQLTTELKFVSRVIDRP